MRHQPRLPLSPVSDSKRGYTVFAVVHGSQPKFTIPEILQDMNRAVRFIRHHAKRLRHRPRPHRHHRRIGRRASVADAGDWPATPANPKAKDPVDRESSRVQAVACFFPPTDFLNYGKPGENALGAGVLKDFQRPVRLPGVRHQGRPAGFVPITDEARILEIGRADLADQPRFRRTTRRRSSSTATRTNSCRSSRPN